MRATIRSLRRQPAFALAAILTIALGVGANTALFAVIYTVLIQPLPFRDPGNWYGSGKLIPRCRSCR